MTHRSPDTRRTAFFAGSFNPYTAGHHSIVERGLRLFDKIVIGIGVNIEKTDPADVASRAASIRKIYADEPRVEVACYNDLTVDAARRHDAEFLLRGARSVKDFEYERTLADVNRRIGNGIETVILPALPELEWLSSTVLRDMAMHGRDIRPYLP